MAKNEFLPFGTAANANVLPNADYQALPARSAGFNAGVAKSEELNTVWRQASVIASVVAQFIVNKSGMDALDNGDTGGLLDNLELAFSQQAKDALPFTQSMGTTGYQKLPSGLIIQWGVLSANPGGAKSVEITGNYPIKFPSNCFQVVACLQDLAGSSGSRTDGVSLFSNEQTGQALLTGPKISVYGLNLGLLLSVRYFAVGA
ncbi:gp53-like domain-containing protein [Serratia marcescens]|uniref:gp53-like domain-containing protein n=1 Tax=Serratia marcescens TaxID=615 RepID=UPI001866688C|nr:hypothetical protein [Serratia marcescens]